MDKKIKEVKKLVKKTVDKGFSNLLKLDKKRDFACEYCEKPKKKGK